VGDVARAMLGDKLITDDFYNGNAFDVSLDGLEFDATNNDLRVAIIPLQKDGPIYMATKAQPDFSNCSSVAAIQSIEIIPKYRLRLAGRKDAQQPISLASPGVKAE
jgi:hypothetical protein